MTFDPTLERRISHRFEDIADNGWFPDRIAADEPYLRTVIGLLQPRPGQRILDAGCARGRFASELIHGTGAQVCGVDLTWSFIHDAQNNVPEGKFVGGSLSALPFADGAFDSVYCVEALEHLPDTALALREMARTLKPDGRLLIIDKSLAAVNPWNGLPTFVSKPLAERRGRWMYGRDFPFRERWFWPWALAREMRRHCASVETKFLTEGRGKASHLYRVLPWLSIDVAWLGRK